MSWKPFRSSGIMFDQYTRKAKKAREQADELLKSGDYLRFKNINRFSKALYLWWLNDNKADKAMYSKTERSFDCYCHIVHKRMFLRNIDLVYKPLQKILQNP